MPAVRRLFLLCSQYVSRPSLLSTTLQVPSPYLNDTWILSAVLLCFIRPQDSETCSQGWLGGVYSVLV